jgi:protoporphyrin/coproporphyrin ferrochelatase
MAAPEMVGILCMAYGSPDSLEQMEAYLLDVREGRPPSPELLVEIRQRYASIGGRSPLLDWTKAQAKAVAEALNRDYASQNVHFKAYIGMRHWEPRIKQAVEAMSADGIQQAVALVMAPHSSRLSVGKYYEILEESILEVGADIDFARIQNWHDHPGLIAAIAEKYLEARGRFAGERDPFVLFTAHSLPSRILDMGDPYDAQLRETSQILVDTLKLERGRWQFCYQSAGASGGPWLGPQVEDVIAELAKSGEKDILVVPIGFVCDHVEVLYDIDIGCQQIARRHGVHLERSPSLNISNVFIQALADLISEGLPGSVLDQKSIQHAPEGN